MEESFMKKMFLVCLLLCLHLSFIQIAFAGDGHEAGREWAEREGIDDPDDCRSRYPGRWAGDNINNSPSFTEGCLEYLRDEGIINDDDEIIPDDDDYNYEDEGEDEDE
jgi:hypothetical protein